MTAIHNFQFVFIAVDDHEIKMSWEEAIAMGKRLIMEAAHAEGRGWMYKYMHPAGDDGHILLQVRVIEGVYKPFEEVATFGVELISCGAVVREHRLRP